MSQQYWRFIITLPPIKTARSRALTGATRPSQSIRAQGPSARYPLVSIETGSNLRATMATMQAVDTAFALTTGARHINISHLSSERLGHRVAPKLRLPSNILTTLYGTRPPNIDPWKIGATILVPIILSLSYFFLADDSIEIFAHIQDLDFSVLIKPMQAIGTALAFGIAGAVGPSAKKRTRLDPAQIHALLLTGNAKGLAQAIKHDQISKEVASELQASILIYASENPTAADTLIRVFATIAMLNGEVPQGIWERLATMLQDIPCKQLQKLGKMVSASKNESRKPSRQTIQRVIDFLRRLIPAPLLTWLKRLIGVTQNKTDTPATIRQSYYRNVSCIFHGQTYSRQIAIHPNSSGVVLINYPGIDGNIDGYRQKYQRMADHLTQTGLAAAVRMDNPSGWKHGLLSDAAYERFIVKGLHDIVDYIRKHAFEICGHGKCKLWLMGFSAGASAIAASAQDLGADKILLMAPAGDAGTEAMLHGIQAFQGDISIVVGENDWIVPVPQAQALYDTASNAHSRRIQVIPDCGHQFRNTTNGKIMSKAPFWAFGNDTTFPSPDGGLELY